MGGSSTVDRLRELIVSEYGPIESEITGDSELTRDLDIGTGGHIEEFIGLVECIEEWFGFDFSGNPTIEPTTTINQLGAIVDAAMGTPA